MPELKCSLGQQKNEDCALEFKYNHTSNDSFAAHRSYICNTHNQYVTEFSKSAVLSYMFPDGTLHVVEIYLDEAGCRRRRVLKTPEMDSNKSPL